VRNIRVDPEELQGAAKELGAAADRLRELGGELSDSGLSAPSYDSQFGPHVQALGAEGEAAVMAQSQRLSELSEQLAAKAEDFIQADERSLSGLAALGAMIHNWLQSLGLSVKDSLLPGATGTPVPTVQAVAIPTPEATGTPVPWPLSDYQQQLALNAQYGFCVYPLTDPDAIQNYVAEGAMTFGKGPFESLPALAPGNTYDGYSTNRWQVATKGLGLLAKAWRSMANLASMEPNVDLQLHYSTYDDGMRVMGMRVENRSDLPVKNYIAEIYEFKTASDGTRFLWRSHRWLPNTYIEPGEMEYISFGSTESPFPFDSDLHVQVTASSLEHERQYRWSAWWIDAETGEANTVEPVFYATE
jgi:uncharacterized protein YukE